MKKNIPDIAAVFVLVLATGIFFLRLFWPTTHILATPDFGSSDAWHASFPMKYALWESLQMGQLPLWNKHIGDGFPLFAEGQTGGLFLPNLLLFSLSDPILAYNLAMAATIATLGLGTYLFLRVCGLLVLPSLFGALTWTFSGPAIAHLPHITLLQGMSMFPVLMALTHLLVTRGPFPWILIWGIVGSQQIFTGFPQGVFLTILATSTYAMWHTIRTRKWPIIAHYVISVILSVGAGAVQLLASWEFLQASQLSGGFDPAMASYFSLPLKHLVTFLDPFALGNPKFATYPHFLQFDGSVFWENIGYIGLLPIFLAAWTVTQMKKIPVLGFFVCLTIGAILMAWGAHSPLYFVYAIWPMTLFRVPSRFLWIAVFGLIFLASYRLDMLIKKIKISAQYAVIGVIVVVHAMLLMHTWWSYHLLVPAYSWMQKPLSVATLQEGRVHTIDAAGTYGRIYNSQGWQNAAPYEFVENGVIPDANLLWNIPTHGVKAGRYLLRPSILDQFLTHEIRMSQTHATMSATAHNLLNKFSVRTILSFLPLTHDGLDKKQTFEREHASLTVYNNPDALPRAYLTTHATTAATLKEATHILLRPDLPDTMVLLEEHEKPYLPDGKQVAHDSAIVTIQKDDHQEIHIAVTSVPQTSLLVLTDTQYPGWHAYVDDQKTPIYTANLAQRAIIVPPGDHTIRFQYEPKFFSIGSKMSIFFYGLIVVLGVVPFGASAIRTFYTTRLHAGRRGHNRDT